MNAIERIRRHPAGNIAVVFTVVLAGCIIAGLVIPDDFRFLHSANIAILLRTIPLLGILAIGVGLLMITGEFDLSVGSVFGFSALVAAMLFREEWPLWLAVIIGLAAGGTIGFVNGLIVTRTAIPSFIATLGSMLVVRGLIRALNDSRPVSFYPGETFEAVLTGSLGLMKAQFLWFLFIGAVAFYFLHLHRYGNHLYAVGGNRQAATATGINVNRTKMIAFTTSGLLAGFAGIIGATRVNSAVVTQGTGLELEAIAACVIGALFLMGGRGTLIGIMLGAALIHMVEDILLLSRAPGYYHETFVGAIIIIAVLMNQVVAKRD